MIQDWSKIQAKSQTAVILGSGPSINDIDTNEWAHLKYACDSWAINNWVYHPTFIPNFYMIETKWYGYDILVRRFIEKQTSYSDVKFLFQRNKQIKMRDGSLRYIRNVVWRDAERFEFDVVSRDSKRTSRITDANYSYHPNALTKSYDCSMTHLLELVDRVGYKRIVLYGVDLSNSFYFWSDGDPKYGEVHHLTNKAHENKPPTDPHNTALIYDFIVDFRRRLNYNGCELLVGSKRSALYPDLPLIKWEYQQ